jgi:hypothetical protein
VTVISAWAIATNQSQKAFGVTVGGEFSAAINDCGLWFAKSINRRLYILSNIGLSQVEWNWGRFWVSELSTLG